MKLNLRSTLETMLMIPSDNVRGNWYHYKCVVCDDHGTHMGINIETGVVKCLRCGWSYSLHTEKPLASTANNLKPGISDLQKMYSYEREDNQYDNAVHQYMKGRGVGLVELGWAYGRDSWYGFVVFPVLNYSGKLVYIQWRKIMGNTAVRYMSVKGTKPRLDCFQLVNPDSRRTITRYGTLVLTEGPVDSLKVRLLTGLWSSPTFGASVSDKMLMDITKAKDEVGLKEVVIMYDNDSAGRLRCESAMYRVKTASGVPTRVCRWPYNSDIKDPGQVTSRKFMAELVNTNREW